MNYTPNFNDPRVLKRIRRACGFARACFSESKPRAFSSRYINSVFGDINKSLGLWLRTQLLTTTNEYYNKDAGKCKEYILNRQGFDYIQQTISGSTICVAEVQAQVREWTQSEFQDELTTRVFDYKDLSNRLWHPLQNLRREAKQQTLREAGFVHQYDIQCCAPRLLWQHAYLHQEEPMDYIPEYIDAYINNRTGIRQQIADAVELDPSAIKVVINALFSGAKLGCNPDFALYKMLNEDRARMTYLQQDPFITGLRQDIREMWQYIAPSMPRRTTIDKNLKTRLVPISSKNKWSRYFELERVVLDSVIDYMKANEIQSFTEHDGWTTTTELDQDSLRDYVLTKTGFKIELEYEFLQ